MQTAIGILGALSIVGYIIGMALVARSDEGLQEAIQNPLAAALVSGAWFLTLIFALLGTWSTYDWRLAFTAIMAVGSPLVGLIASDLKRQWIAASLFALGFLATAGLYCLLLLG